MAEFDEVHLSQEETFGEVFERGPLPLRAEAAIGDRAQRNLDRDRNPRVPRRDGRHECQVPARRVAGEGDAGAAQREPRARTA